MARLTNRNLALSALERQRLEQMAQQAIQAQQFSTPMEQAPYAGMPGAGVLNQPLVGGMRVGDLVPVVNMLPEGQAPWETLQESLTRPREGVMDYAALPGEVLGALGVGPRLPKRHFGGPTRRPETTEPGQIATRFPTAMKSTENPLTEHDLVVGAGSSAADPAALARNANLVRQYPQMTTRVRNPEKRAEALVEFERDNLNRLYEEVPPEIRDQTKRWYEGANRLANEAAERHGILPEQAAGVYAALSPQKDWYQNVSLGDRLMDIAGRGGEFTPQMASALSRLEANIKSKAGRQAVERVQGRRYDELPDAESRALWIRLNDEAHGDRSFQAVTPTGERGELVRTAKGDPARVAWSGVGTIANALRTLEDARLENISQQMGGQHKVRSFYNNIIAPQSGRGDVTIDTHAVAAGLLSPYAGKDAPVLHNFGSGIKGQRGAASSAVTGNQGTYGMHAEAYRRAAEDQGVLPREMQSITWEAIRGLFNNKSPRVKAQAAEIWDSHKRGLITQRQAQDAMLEMAGGINLPTWMQ